MLYNLLKTVISNTEKCQRLLEYTKRGTALVSKRTIMAEELSELISTFRLPNNIVSGRYTRVGRNFDASNNYTDILSFFDNDGKLVLKLQDVFKDSLNLSTKVSQFRRPELLQWTKEGGMYNHKFNLTEVNSFIFENGKPTHKISEFQQLYNSKDGSKIGSIGIIDRSIGDGVVNETQSLMQCSNKNPNIGYKLELKHSPNGENTITKVEAKGIEVNENDPYLSTYLYKRDDFVKTSYVHALKRNGLYSPELAPELNANSERLLKAGVQGEYEFSTEIVHMQPKMVSNTEIVRNENHELWHHIQICMIEQLFGVTKDTGAKARAYVEKYGRKLTSKQIEDAKTYYNEFCNYESKNHGEYLRQKVEREAREKGSEAVAEYKNNKNALFSQLPYVETDYWTA